MSTPDNSQEQRRIPRWGDFETMVQQAVARMLIQGYRPKRVIPIANGGIIPAAGVFYSLLVNGVDVELLPAVRCSSYDSMNRRGEVRSVFPDQLLAPEVNDVSTLFVDEICDSGETIKHLRGIWGNASFLAIVTKNDVPDFWALHDPAKHWWVFPWEK